MSWLDSLPALTDTNYNSQNHSMCMAMNLKHKFHFVNGSIPKLDALVDPDLASSWQCIDDIVSIWLLNSISKDITTSIVYCDFAATIWSDL